MSKLKDLKILEAILFATNEPILENDLKDKIYNKEEILVLLKELQKLYSDRGVNLKKTGNSWELRFNLNNENIISF